jgi:hypothetical protein
MHRNEQPDPMDQWWQLAFDWGGQAGLPTSAELSRAPAEPGLGTLRLCPRCGKWATD